jgi:hypothetical protein
MKTSRRFFEFSVWVVLFIFFGDSFVLAAPVTASRNPVVREAGTVFIQIPKHLGMIRKTVPAPAGAKVIFHIQNPHGHYAAQNNIRKLLRHLSRE